MTRDLNEIVILRIANAEKIEIIDEMLGALDGLLEGEELDPSGLDVRYYITEEDWEKRINAAKAAAANARRIIAKAEAQP